MEGSLSWIKILSGYGAIASANPMPLQTQGKVVKY
jgi:hypothetical protein